jgi:ParB family chromosome partitioning protein
VRQTEALAARRGPFGTNSRPLHPKDPDTAALERTLAAKLGLRVDIVFDGTSGVVRLHYRSLEQLDGLVALLTRD